MWAWWRKNRLRGLMAASLYEPLSPEERTELDNALRGDAALRAENASLAGVKHAIPRREIEFQGDLLPIIRQRLAEAPVKRGANFRPWLATGAMALFAVTVAGTLFWRGAPPASPSVSLMQANAPVSMMAAPIAEACRLMDENDIVAAQRVLAENLAGFPEDPMAGQAQTMLADLEFSQLQRYPESLAAYEHLRSRYAQAFMDSPQSVERYNLLTETKAEAFAPLYALDAAKQSRNPFEQCERLVAQYPASGIANLAMNEMLGLSGPSSGNTPQAVVASLEQVRQRCTDPTAIAQLNLALGNAYRDQLGDVVRARSCYDEAAASPHLAVADSARAALARLETPTR